jgi:magnesium-transporting ATPase (P-type)
VRVIFLKGAPEVVLNFCHLTEPTKHDWLAQATHLGEHGLRVLACAYQLLPPHGSFVVNVAQNSVDLTMSCVLGFDDPPRDEAIDAIQSAHAAGITIKMITGDHPLTAFTIGRRLGIPNDHQDQSNRTAHGPSTGNRGENQSVLAQQIITGADLDALLVMNNLTALDQVILNHNIFARASPAHKLLIVQSLQRQHLSCCMTGAGVNDAPALKQANVGVAMGTGTEVAKEASHIIITDNSFATIVAAIRQGRCTYSNLLKILIFILPINAAQAWSLFLALILDLPIPFSGLQILWINMVPAILLGFVFAFEPPDPSLMMFPPRPIEKSIFGSFLIWRIVFVATLLVVSVLGIVQWEVKDQQQQRRDGSSDGSSSGDEEKKQIQTMAINALVVGQAFYLFNCRYPRYNVWPWQLVTGNRVIFVGLTGVGFAQVLLTYSKAFQSVFETKAIDDWAWLRMMLIGAILFLIIEVEKALVLRWHRWRGGPRCATWERTRR